MVPKLCAVVFHDLYTSGGFSTISDNILKI